MKILLIAALALTISTLSAQIHLIPGAKMPDVTADWIRNPQEKAPTADQKRIFILNFVDVLSPDIYQTLRLIETLEKKYAAEPKVSVKVRTVAKNTMEELKRTLAADASPFSVSIGADREGKTFRNFATGIATLPYTFMSVNDVIAWNGHPVEIETVMDSILNDTFSLDRQKTITKLRADLQTALRSGLPDVIGQTADKILAVAPNDAIGMQAKLYAFELKGERAKAIVFLKGHIQKNPANSIRPRMLLLDLLLRTGNLTDWSASIGDTAKEAEKRPEDALNFAAYLLDRAPLGDLPVAAVRKLSGIALTGFRKTENKDALCDALEIAAKVSYSICRLKEALTYQKEAVAIRRTTNSSSLKRAESVLAFYEQLDKLR